MSRSPYELLAPDAQRVCDEKFEVDQRRTHLMVWQTTERYDRLSDVDKDLLQRQKKIMAEYSAVLGLRLERMRQVR